MDPNAAINVLSEASKILAGLKIDSWLTDGTLLGYYREGGFISHDCDVDIGINISSWSESIIPTMRDNGYELTGSRGELDNGLEYSFFKDGISIDFFFFYEEGSNLWHSAWLKKLQLKYKYPKFSLKKVVFLDHDFLAPEKEEQYLVIKYGQGWRVPDKKWHWAFSPKNVELAHDSFRNKIAFVHEKLRWKIRQLKSLYRKAFNIQRNK